MHLVYFIQYFGLMTHCSKSYIRAAHALLKGKGMSLVITCYPKLAQLIPNWSGWNYVASLAKVRHDLFDSIIDEHRATRSEGQPRDFIDVYLSEVDKTEDKTSSFYHTVAGSFHSRDILFLG